MRTETREQEVKAEKAQAMVAEAKERFFRDLRSAGRSEKTLVHYGEAIDQLYAHYFAGDSFRDPRKMAAGDIESFLVNLRRLKRSDATVQGRYRALHRFFAWQVARGHLDRSPMAGLTKPRVVAKAIVPYTFRELQGMIEATRNWNGTALRDLVIVELLLNTGMRAGELCTLRPQDVRAGRLLVRGKGKKERWLTLEDITETHLRQYMAQPVPLGRSLFGLSVSGLQQLIERLAHAAGVPGAHVHRFRHTFACDFLRAGGQVTTLQKVLGHSNLSTTMIYIAYIEEEMMGEAMRKFAPFARFANGGTP